MTQRFSSAPLPSTPAAPWWREPTMWLVVGGPAVVVVAAIATSVIAVRGADVSVERRAAPAALKSRNHVQTGVPEAARAPADAPPTPSRRGDTQ